MSFKKPVQKFTASVNEVTLGTGDKALTIGGEKCYPFYSFDSEIPPAIGVEVGQALAVSRCERLLRRLQ